MPILSFGIIFCRCFWWCVGFDVTFQFKEIHHLLCLEVAKVKSVFKPGNKSFWLSQHQQLSLVRNVIISVTNGTINNTTPPGNSFCQEFWRHCACHCNGFGFLRRSCENVETTCQLLPWEKLLLRHIAFKLLLSGAMPSNRRQVVNWLSVRNLKISTALLLPVLQAK